MAMKIIDNFTGRLTRDNIGNMNSGLAKYDETFGNDPFSNIGNLTWLEQAIRIDPTQSVITDLIICAKPRLESGVTYMYAVGHTGRVYKIQVNDPSAFNPDLDNPVLLTTITSGSPTFKYGSSITFFGSTPKIYIGHDTGVTSLNFDGTGESYRGTNMFNNIPRPVVNFLGKLYWPDNGGSFTTLDSSLTYTASTSTTSLTPNIYPLQIRDLDVTPDGNYIQITASEIPAADMTSTAQDTNSLSPGKSYKMLWNGISGTSFTSYTTFDSYSITSNITFGNENYTMGYDLNGASIYSGNNKVISLPSSISPNFNAMFSSGNMMGFMSTEVFHSYLAGGLMFYGQYDDEVPKGLFRFLSQPATDNSPHGNQTDIIKIPVCLAASNLLYGSSSSGYGSAQVGSSKLYFSTLETSGIPTTAYKLYKFITAPTGTGTAIQGVYETQNETSFALFRSIISKKFKVNSVRFYTTPLATNNSFKIDLIGADNNPINGASKTFTVGTNCNVGDDHVWYNPSMQPTYSVGVRITNLGTANWVGAKLELDYESEGQ